MRGRSWFAAVRPQGKGAGTWALPKGLVDPGEGMRDAAAREVAEETGLEVEVVERLGDTRYTYTWEDERIFKIVGFFLMRPVGGRIGEILPAMRVEVAEARWLPLLHAGTLLSYPGERRITLQAHAWIQSECTRGRAAR